MQKSLKGCVESFLYFSFSLNIIISCIKLSPFLINVCSNLLPRQNFKGCKKIALIHNFMDILVYKHLTLHEISNVFEVFFVYVHHNHEECK